MKLDKHITLAGMLAIAAITIVLLLADGDDAGGGAADAGMAADSAHAGGDGFERGPQGGRLLREAEFALEITIYETGVPPEFRLYGYSDGERVAPEALAAEMTLHRLGGTEDRIAFEPEGAYLRGLAAVREPHSFDVEIEAEHAGQTYRWRYASHEGRTEIPARVAAAQGIAVESAGPAEITRVVALTGTVQTDPGRISQVRARFPGIVTEVRRTVGELVSRGESLGAVETNESLRAVSIDAPISGLVVDRNVQAGQVTGDEPLFVIADLSAVWVQLDVFGKDLDAVAVGQPARIETLDGTEILAAIDWVSPLVAHGSQSVRARVAIPNPENRLRPGQFVRANVITDVTRVPLAVARTGLQRFRDFDVVFARVGDVYEARMLELGRMDSEHVEVLSGLEPGEVYVTVNSYLIKADIEKSGASHDH